MKHDPYMPYITCGKVSENTLPAHRSVNEGPIVLAELKVHSRHPQPHVLFNYSQNLSYQVLGENPEIQLTYQLVKTPYKRDPVLLETWNFGVSLVFPADVSDLNTVEPLVLNYCDHTDITPQTQIHYSFQLSETKTNHASFEVLSQTASAIILNG
ncbi:hypothetical protein [Halobacillus yeomjeoni]|uniref:Uncharacterized protein n=1 Tax=Halobacillus yeomjeoni TaxID=311194 RepID=A0A931HUK2_9BACI|nr:hypothetical protein [Halobacillus yeomjeoni]MBH0229683.1 hypothetical protein [Halobacillus yeomjeoni]